MSDEELAGAKGGKVLHFPTVLGADVITYNLPEVKDPLHLTGPLVADIFLGKITKWNDARIAAENSGGQASRRGHPRRPSLRRQRDDLHLHRLPHRGEPGVGVGTGEGEVGAVAGRTRRQGE